MVAMVMKSGLSLHMKMVRLLCISSYLHTKANTRVEANCMLMPCTLRNVVSPARLSHVRVWPARISGMYFKCVSVTG